MAFRSFGSSKNIGNMRSLKDFGSLENFGGYSGQRSVKKF